MQSIANIELSINIGISLINNLNHLKAENINIFKVDTDINTDIASDLNINSIPSLLIMRNGEVLSEIIGNMKLDDLQHEIDSFI